MRWSRFAVFVLIVTVLQAGMLDVFAVTKFNIKPDLLLILVVFFAIYSNTTDAIITSFTIGFAADLIGATMGPQIISFGIFGTLLTNLNHVITIKKMSYQTAVIFIMALLAGILVHFLIFLKGQPAAPGTFKMLFGSAVYSAIIGPFIFLPAAWVMRVKLPRYGR